MLRKFGIIAVLSLIVAALAAVPALAASPHFINASATGPASDGSLAVNFKIAGLGDNQTITVTASADADATYACINGGGKNPKASNKRDETGRVTASGDFTSGKNGSVTGSLTLEPPASTLDCPSGQRLVLASVTYTNVTVSAPGAGTESIPGTFSRTFFNV